jgi:hypothetical protein
LPMFLKVLPYLSSNSFNTTIKIPSMKHPGFVIRLVLYNLKCILNHKSNFSFSIAFLQNLAILFRNYHIICYNLYETTGTYIWKCQFIVYEYDKII